MALEGKLYSRSIP